MYSFQDELFSDKNKYFLENKHLRSPRKSQKCVYYSYSVYYLGAFNCTCFDGFNGTGYGDDCEDVNECMFDDLNTCDPEFGICENLNGTYNCTCLDGFDQEWFLRWIA